MTHVYQEFPQEESASSGPIGLTQQEIAEKLDAIDYVQQLLKVGQDLCEDIHRKDVNRLRDTIQELTKERVFIIFHSQQTKVHISTKIHSSFSIQFGKFVYGLLCVSVDPYHPEQSALSLPLAKLLAQLYGWLLYTCEQTAIVQGQYQKLEYQVCGKLSKREHEVLTLMCSGFTQERIAEKLNIALSTVVKHKQRIYYQLGVHNENDALIAAYHTGIVSLVKIMNEQR